MKGITGSLVKHNGLMLAQPSGNGLTIFDLSSLLVSSPLLLERLVSIVKEILYYATRKGSALTVLLDEGDESSLADFEVVYRSDIENNGYVSGAIKLAKKQLKVKKFFNARLFSDRVETIEQFLQLGNTWSDVQFEGYAVSSTGSVTVML